MPINFDEVRKKLKEDTKKGTIDFNAIHKQARADDMAGIDTRNNTKMTRSKEQVREAANLVNTDEIQALLNGNTWLDNEIETSGIPMGASARMAQEASIRAGKKFNATEAERATQAAKDLKFATESGTNRFLTGLAQGLSLEPLNYSAGTNPIETELALDELINKTGAGVAGKLVGTGVQYATPYMAGGNALKATKGISKLGKIGAEVATDAILSAPLNAANVTLKQGLTGKEAVTEFGKQMAGDIALGAGLGVAGELVGKSLKGKVPDNVDEVAKKSTQESTGSNTKKPYNPTRKPVPLHPAERKRVREEIINKINEAFSSTEPEKVSGIDADLVKRLKKEFEKKGVDVSTREFAENEIDSLTSWWPQYLDEDYLQRYQKTFGEGNKAPKVDRTVGGWLENKQMPPKVAETSDAEFERTVRDIIDSVHNPEDFEDLKELEYAKEKMFKTAMAIKNGSLPKWNASVLPPELRDLLVESKKLYTTNEPVTIKMFHGSGKPKDQIYAKVQTPVAGKGKYYAFTEKEAKFYGDNIEAEEIKLKNPLVVRDDVEWRRLAKEAGWPSTYPHYSANGLATEQEVIEYTENLRKHILASGHDGLIVQFEPSDYADISDITGQSIKAIRRIFGHDQVVVYTLTKNAKKMPPKVETSTQPLKDLGADTNRIKTTPEGNVETYGAFGKTDLAKGSAFGETTKAAKTVYKSKVITEEGKELIKKMQVEGDLTKYTKKNKAGLEKANSLIKDEGVDKAYDVFINEAPTGNEDTVILGARLMQEFLDYGDDDKFMNVVDAYCDLLSRTGRTLQAANVIKKLSPEGRLISLQKAVTRMNRKNGTDIKLSNDAIKAVKEATTDAEKEKAMEQAMLEVWNQTPATLQEKLDAFRYFSMLFNTKTIIRNLVGNTLFTGLKGARNAVSTIGQNVFLEEGKRTRAFLNSGDEELIKFAKETWENGGRSAYKGSGKFSETYRPQEARVYKHDIFEKPRRASVASLEVPDEWFGKRAYVRSLAGYLKAQNINPKTATEEVLEKAKEWALKDAQNTTFRDSTAFSRMMSSTKARLKSSDSWTAKAGNFLLEGVMPFTKTPYNITARAIEYSPLGLAKTLLDTGWTALRKGEINANQLIDDFASGLTGTGLFGLGMWFYNNGWLTTGSDDTEEYYYDQMLGEQNYALTNGEESFTIDWASPAAIPLLMGAECMKLFEQDGMTFADALDSAMTITDPLLEASFMQGVNNALESARFGESPVTDIILNTTTSYASQFVPTALGQIARTADPVRRSTTSTDESKITRSLEKNLINKNIAKLPKASQTLQPYIDIWGREQSNGGLGERALENFVLPGYYSKRNLTDVDREILRLAKGLSDAEKNEVYPSATYQYEQSYHGTDYRMNEEDFMQYQKTAGQYKLNELEKLFKTTRYKTATNADRIAMIKSVYSMANLVAKNDFLVSQGVPSSVWLEDAKGLQNGYDKSIGLTEKEYYLLYKEAKSYDTNYSNEEAIAYLDKQNLTQEQKRALFTALCPTTKSNPY